LLVSEQLQSPNIYSSFIDRSDQFHIKLPIVERLQSFYQASVWYELVKTTVNRMISPSKLRSLISSGQALQGVHTQIQKQIGELQVQLEQLDIWEEKCRQLSKDE
jgi:hypothetical protein